MTPDRAERLKVSIKRRQTNFTVILENVHDRHNVGAVLRSCDSVGIAEIFILYTDPRLSRDFIELGDTSSSGARRWVKVNYYTDIEACFEAVKSRYDNIYSTHLAEDSVSLYKLDLTKSVALLFGNESTGLSKSALAYSDGNFIIPQMGLVQSLNISVAAAVSIYEGLRQRENIGMYESAPISVVEQHQLFEEWSYNEVHKKKFKTVKRIK